MMGYPQIQQPGPRRTAERVPVFTASRKASALLTTLRVLLGAVILSAAVGLTHLAIITLDGRGPGFPELVFWIGNQIGFGALALMLLLTVARRRAR